jgi:hypothetical protein
MQEYLFFADAFAFDIIEWGFMTLSVRLASYQPQYFPRLHYFARMLDADVFTISDYLQYVRKHTVQNAEGSRRVFSYQAHAPIKSADGVLLLDVPVRRGGAGGKQALNEAAIDYAGAWQQKQLNIIQANYARAPYFRDVYPQLATLIRRTHDSLAAFSTATTLWSLGHILELPGERSLAAVNGALPRSPFRLRSIVRMSETGIPPAKKPENDANDWLIKTCRRFNATEYYFGGTAARAYMDYEKYERARVRLIEQQWQCRAYPQQHGGFVPNLSIIDLLMNVSPAEARSILYTPSPVR